MVATDPRTLLADKDAEIARLREQSSRREYENEGLRAELAVANANITELLKRVGELAEAVAKGNDRIAELLVIVQRKKSPPKPKPKEPKAPASLDDKARKAFNDRPTPPEPRGRMKDRPRPKQRPTGRKPLPKHLPADVSTVRPVRCACGCGEFVWVDEVIEEKLDIKAHQRRRITHRKTGKCKSCGARTTGEAPPSPFPRSKVSCGWLAWLITQKFRLIVPLDRIRLYLGAQGIALSESFLVTQVTAAANLLEAIDGEHWKELLAGAWMATDGTGLKVQVRGHGLHHGHLEVYHNGRIVVFQYEREKGGETQADKLAKFEGGLLVDAESRYNETMRRHPKIRELNCNAHPRRKLKDAEKVQPVLAADAGRYVSAMFEEEATARERGLQGDELLAWRRERIRPIVDEFEAWKDAVLPALILDDDPLGKVLRYYNNHWAELFRFIDDPACVAIDNSGSEREFQPVAKLRLNCLFAGSTEGAHRTAILLGIVHTCKRLGIDPEAYMTWLFVRRGTHRHKYNLSVAQLTPAAYKATLAA